MPSPPHPRLRNRHSHPRAVSNGAHPSDYAARELWTAIPCDSLEDRRVVPTSESPTTRRWPHQSIQARLNVVAGATDASRAMLLTSCCKVELLTAIFGFL